MGGQDAWWFMSLLALIFLAAASLTPLLTPRKKEEKWKSITRVKCMSCGYTEERDFTKGDYVGKIVGKCPKCGGQLVVDAIFRRKEEPSKADRQGKL